MGKRGRKGTVISRLRDIRSSSYRKARGFRQCQLAQWSEIWAGKLASYFIVLILRRLLSPKTWKELLCCCRHCLSCGEMHKKTRSHFCLTFKKTFQFKFLQNIRLYLTFLSKISINWCSEYIQIRFRPMSALLFFWSTSFFFPLFPMRRERMPLHVVASRKSSAFCLVFFCATAPSAYN